MSMKEKRKRSIEGEEKILKKKKLKNNKKLKENNFLAEKSEETEIAQLTENVNGDENEKEVKKNNSKRQLKKQKAELRAEEVKEINRREAAQKALNYVSKWKHAKSQWKFEKLRQIWLIDNFLNDKYVPDANFATVLEYFESCKGSARKQLLDKAMVAVKEAENRIEEDQEVIDTIEYKRARLLLQALPTES